ncbi:MAG: enoyl-CoA hydratase/isomerase family protein [Deltaproteobacteria bacterium]|nr:enoyl-CoA hydratase/isomerase family protein [Deltaproteobacteria bacterium]
MGEPAILYEARNGLGYITLNRPEALNSFTKPSLDLLADILTRCKDDETCRAVIITGAGEKAFSAGADLNTFLQEVAKPIGGKEWSRYGQRAFAVLDLLGKPSVAALNGLTIGGGLELSLACTFRIASEKARLGFSEITLGFLPGWGGTSRMTKLIGKTRAAELVLTGDLISAEEALRLGVVSKVVPPQELIPASEALLSRIIKHSPIAVSVALEAVHYAQYQPLEEAMILESNLGGLACDSEDAKEGLRAFLEKRKPNFKGR